MLFSIVSSERTLILVCHSEEHKKEMLEIFLNYKKLASKITQSGSQKRGCGGLDVHATITGTKKLYDKANTGSNVFCSSVDYHILKLMLEQNTLTNIFSEYTFSSLKKIIYPDNTFK